MTGDDQIALSFEGLDAAAADEAAFDLVAWLSEEAPGVQLERVRDDPLTQDFGATVVIILGSAAAANVAKGIAAWLARRQDVNVTLARTTAEGEREQIKIQGQANQRTLAVVREFITQS